MTPPRGLFLEVHKSGRILEVMPLTRPCTIFGRHTSCDVVVVDQSISRQHCALLHRRGGRVFVQDLGATHGTMIGTQRLLLNGCEELPWMQPLRVSARGGASEGERAGGSG